MKTTIILLILAFGLLPMQSEAKTDCDSLFVNNSYTQIDRKSYPECVNRWTYMSNQIKRSFSNSMKNARL